MHYRLYVSDQELVPIEEAALEPVKLLCRVLGRNVHLDRSSRIMYIDSPVQGKTIFLDPAHGGADHYNRGVSGYVEAEGVLEISLRLRDRLLSAGARVVLTRDDDTTVTLAERCRLVAEERPGLVVSVHTAAVANTALRGVASLYSYVQLLASRRLAVALAREVSRSTGSPCRGIFFCWRGKEADGYLPLLNSFPTPAAVIECGCHSFVEEERLLQEPWYRQQCADGLYAGIVRYLGGIRLTPDLIKEVREAAKNAVRPPEAIVLAPPKAIPQEETPRIISSPPSPAAKDAPPPSLPTAPARQAKPPAAPPVLVQPRTVPPWAMPPAMEMTSYGQPGTMLSLTDLPEGVTLSDAAKKLRFGSQKPPSSVQVSEPLPPGLALSPPRRFIPPERPPRKGG